METHTPVIITIIKCLHLYIQSHIIVLGKEVQRMSRTANVFARVEPDLKEDSESILTQLGIPMSNAIGLFLRQVVIHRGLPFEVKLPVRMPVALDSLSVEEFNAEVEKGYSDMNEGKVRPASDVFADLHKDYGL